ncbi:MAG: exodeoxyribonuclease III, partial [Hyphomicrobiales bacterium]
ARGSRSPLRSPPRSRRGPDPQARYLEAVISVGDGALRVASIYLPNGNPTDTPKFPYKLAWMERLRDHAQVLRAGEEAVALCGDFNVIATDDDVYNAPAWRQDALMRAETQARFFALTHQGYTDAWRACSNQTHHYTFWDYQAGAWQKDHGLRIDYILLSPQAADRLQSAHIDSRVRGWEKPSDH